MHSTLCGYDQRRKTLGALCFFASTSTQQQRNDLFVTFGRSNEKTGFAAVRVVDGGACSDRRLHAHHVRIVERHDAKLARIPARLISTDALLGCVRFPLALLVRHC
jgi:hypothetical protein